jgi:sugar/nucleoside kinase (ribokinase family)
MLLELAGFGNALMDALVVVQDERWLKEMEIKRGVAHMVDHPTWEKAYQNVRHLKVAFESGGSCANTIATAALLGANTVFCGQVGNDQMGQLYASKMTQYCGTHQLQFSDAIATGKCLSVIGSEDAERTMITHLGAAVGIETLAHFAQPLGACKIGHYEGYMLLGPDTRALSIEAMKRTKAGGGLVSLDVSDPFVVTQIKDVIWSLLDQYVDIVFLNADEATALTGATPEAAIQLINQRAKTSTIIVKLGSRGSLVLDNGHLHTINVEPVQAIDTTGAGDAYAGGYLYGKVKGWDVASCGTLASKVAALTVAQIGAVARQQTALHQAKELCNDGHQAARL